MCSGNRHVRKGRSSGRQYYRSLERRRVPAPPAMNTSFRRQLEPAINAATLSSHRWRASEEFPVANAASHGRAPVSRTAWRCPAVGDAGEPEGRPASICPAGLPPGGSGRFALTAAGGKATIVRTARLAIHGNQLPLGIALAPVHRTSSACPVCSSFGLGHLGRPPTATR
jgi:hypothetical protein